MSATRRASRDFLRALFKDAKTTEAKIPIMAITTSNSIKVNPFLDLNIFYNQMLFKIDLLILFLNYMTYITDYSIYAECKLKILWIT